MCGLLRGLAAPSIAATTAATALVIVVSGDVSCWPAVSATATAAQPWWVGDWPPTEYCIGLTIVTAVIAN